MLHLEKLLTVKSCADTVDTLLATVPNAKAELASTTAEMVVNRLFIFIKLKFLFFVSLVLSQRI